MPDRIQLVSGDCFHDALPVAGGYLLMEVLRDCVDDKTLSIIAAVLCVAPLKARVFTVEPLVSASLDPHFGTVLDIIMLMVTG